MKYLLDTHVMLWFLEDSDQISPKVRKILSDGESELYWSVASFWEMTVKVSLGKLSLKEGWVEILNAEKKINRIRDLSMETKHCEPHLKLPWHHRDPFDRILICQAISEKMTLLTKDNTISKYQVKTLW